MRYINYINYINEFGIKVFFIKTIRHILYKKNNKLSWIINNYNEKKIEKILFSKKYDDSIDFKDIYPDDYKVKSLNNAIFTMWFQGESEAPILVKECIKNIKKFSNGHNVIVIDKNNYKKYVKIPKIYRI